MTSPSVTYTFTNSTAADATQVNQNFTDLINAMTDGTKSFSIDALTVGGAALLNGNVTLGNATSDDITVTGYLASSLIPKTTTTYALGGASNIWTTAHITTVNCSTVDALSTAGVAVKGRTDGSNVSAGYIGQTITSTVSDVTMVSGGAGQNAASINLTAGRWLIIAKAYFEATVALSAFATAKASISASSGTQNTQSIVYHYGMSGSSDVGVHCGPLVASLSTATTYYLVCQSSFTTGTSGNLRINGAASEMYAIRFG